MEAVVTSVGRPRRGFTLRQWGRIGLYVALMLAAAGWVEARYRFGFVVQVLRCLEDTSAVLYEIGRSPPERDRLYAHLMPALAAPVFPDLVVVKWARGLPGDRVEVGLEEVRVNGRAVARGLGVAGDLGHPPEAFVRSFVVPPDSVFMLGDTPESYDSRYYGVVPISTHGLGRAWRLW